MLAMFSGVPGFVALLRMMMRANLFDKAGMSWLVHMTAADHTVSCAQAHRILRFYAAEPLSQRCAIFVSLFPKITDRQSIPALIRENFTVDERAPLRKALGRLYYYSATFPTVRRPVGPPVAPALSMPMGAGRGVARPAGIVGVAGLVAGTLSPRAGRAFRPAAPPNRQRPGGADVVRAASCAGHVTGTRLTNGYACGRQRRVLQRRPPTGGLRHAVRCCNVLQRRCCCRWATGLRSATSSTTATWSGIGGNGWRGRRPRRASSSSTLSRQTTQVAHGLSADRLSTPCCVA